MKLEQLPIVEIRRLHEVQVDALAQMLVVLENAGELRHFHPHPFSRNHLEMLADSSRQDLHYVMTDGNAVFSYGLLRGWDEGYATPSLGIATHPAHRGKGHGALMMNFLHAAARARGAARVRLRVHGDNERAISLYRAAGYRFEAASDVEGLIVAYKALLP
mgnify:CR=1 FL=1